MDLSHIPYTELSEDWLICDEPLFPLPVNVRENWRPMPVKRRCLCSLRGIEGFGNFTPLWTNGLLCIVLRVTGKWEFVHLENIDFTVQQTLFAPPTTVAKKTRRSCTAVTGNLQELLGF